MNADNDFNFEMNELNANACEFKPQNFKPPKESRPKSTVLTKEIFSLLPPINTLPPPGISFSEHFRNQIMTFYEFRKIPDKLFEYMVDTGLIKIAEK